MPLDYSTLLPGQRVSSQTCLLDADTVASYTDAVGDGARLPAGDDGCALAPPMAVAALSLRGVINDLAIPGGTLHVGQELEFRKAVAIGETLECRATMLQNAVRGSWRFIVVQLEVENSAGDTLMSGKSTIMLPV